MTTTLSVEQTHDVRLDIFLDQVSWFGLYDRIEVWRSVLGEGGPYEELTAEGWTPARLPTTGGEPSLITGPKANLVGKDLRVLVGPSQEITVTFTGVDPLTFAQAAAQVSSAAAPLLRAFVDAAGRFVLETVAPGGQTRLQVLGGEAAPLLGLPVAPHLATTYGHDPRLPLTAGKVKYAFRDYYGKNTYFYKTRLANRMTEARSDFSRPMTAQPPRSVSASRIALGYLQLMQRDGRPDAKKQVMVFSPVLGFQVEGSTFTGGQEVFLTDDQGYLEIPLLRGLVVDVGIGGTSLIRRVTVPTDPSVEKFDLLDPAYGEDDVFAVKRLDLPYATRRNL